MYQFECDPLKPSSLPDSLMPFNVFILHALGNGAQVFYFEYLPWLHMNYIYQIIELELLSSNLFFVF